MWSFTKDQKVFNSRVCFFIHGSNDIGNDYVDGIQGKLVSRSHPERQTAESRIHSNRKRRYCLRQRHRKCSRICAWHRLNRIDLYMLNASADKPNLPVPMR